MSRVDPHDRYCESCGSILPLAEAGEFCRKCQMRRVADLEQADEWPQMDTPDYWEREYRGRGRR